MIILYFCFYLSISLKGTDIFNGFIKAHSRGVKIRIVQNANKDLYQRNDTKALEDLGVIELRTINFTELIGAGILHTKLWIADGQHFYVGSANSDWRSLTQVSIIMHF